MNDRLSSPWGPPRKRWLFTVMGLVFLTQGLGKLLDFSAYLAALEHFRFLPAAALPAAGALWIAGELGSGLALVAAGVAVSPRASVARVGAAAALAVSLGYAVLDIQGYVRGLPITNCTCFGAYAPQRLTWFVLLQEAYVLVLLVWLLRKASRWTR